MLYLKTILLQLERGNKGERQEARRIIEDIVGVLRPPSMADWNPRAVKQDTSTHYTVKSLT